MERWIEFISAVLFFLIFTSISFAQNPYVFHYCPEEIVVNPGCLDALSNNTILVDSIVNITVDTYIQTNLYVSGKVGINTTNPKYTLDVQGTSAEGILRVARSDATGFTMIVFGHGSPITDKWKIGLHYNSNFIINDAQNSLTPFAIEPGTPTNTLYLDSSGNVGIGLSSPEKKLDINGSAIFRVGGSGGNVIISTPAGESGITISSSNRADIRFDDNILKIVVGSGTGVPSNTNGISITTSGNVGIGTTSPSEKLEVAGNIKADEFIDRDSFASFSSWTALHTFQGNALAFKSPYKVERWDGSSWVDATDARSWKLLFDMKDTSVSLAGLNYTNDEFKLRFYFDFGGNWPYTIYGIGFVWQHAGPITYIKVEHSTTSDFSSDVNTLLEKSGSFGGGDADIFFRFSGGYYKRYLRITVEFKASSADWAKQMYLKEIYALAGNEWKSAWANTFPFSWNENKKVWFPTDIDVANNIYVGTVSGSDGDIVFWDKDNKHVIHIDAASEGPESSDISVYISPQKSFFLGNVGIGIDSPEAKLHVKSEGSGAELKIEITNSSKWAGIDILHPSNNWGFYVYSDGTLNIRDNTAGKTLATFVSNDDVSGIIAGPEGGGRHLIINDISEARWAFATGNYDLSIQNDYGGSWRTRVIITESGNVGIGTSSPQAKLHVTGTIIGDSERGRDTSYGLVFYMPFDGDTKDYSIYNHNGQLKNGATLETGIFGKAVRCDKANSEYVNIPESGSSSLDLTQGFTWEVWIYPFSCSGGIIFNKESSYEWMISSSCEVAWALMTAGSWEWHYTGIYVPLNEWTHLALTYDGTYVRVYVNGELKSTIKDPDGGAIDTNDNDLRICARGGDGSASQFFDGMIDEVRIYNRILSEEEIKAHYIRGLLSLFNERGIVAYKIKHSEGTHPNYVYDLISRFVLKYLDNIQTSTVLKNMDHTWSDDKYIGIYATAIYIEEDGYYDFGANADDAVAVFVDGILATFWGAGHGVDGEWYQSSFNSYCIGLCDGDGDDDNDPCWKKTLHPNGIRLNKGWHIVVAVFEEISGGDSIHIYIRPHVSGEDPSAYNGTSSKWALIGEKAIMAGYIKDFKTIPLGMVLSLLKNWMGQGSSIIYDPYFNNAIIGGDLQVSGNDIKGSSSGGSLTFWTYQDFEFKRYSGGTGGDPHIGVWDENNSYYVRIWHSGNEGIIETNKGAVKIKTPSGYVYIGPQNTGWSHFVTDRPKFWFNKGIVVDTGFIASYDENLHIKADWDSSGTHLYITTSGNVGIGTTNPEEKLDVNGSAIIRGDLQVNGNDIKGNSGSGSLTFWTYQDFEFKRYSGGTGGPPHIRIWDEDASDYIYMWHSGSEGIIKTSKGNVYIANTGLKVNRAVSIGYGLGNGGRVYLYNSDEPNRFWAYGYWNGTSEERLEWYYYNGSAYHWAIMTLCDTISTKSGQLAINGYCTSRGEQLQVYGNAYISGSTLSSKIATDNLQLKPQWKYTDKSSIITYFATGSVSLSVTCTDGGTINDKNIKFIDECADLPSYLTVFVNVHERPHKSTDPFGGAKLRVEDAYIWDDNGDCYVKARITCYGWGGSGTSLTIRVDYMVIGYYGTTSGGSSPILALVK